MTERVAAGEIELLSRGLTGCPDPLRLFEALDEGGDAPAVLFESADMSDEAGLRSLMFRRAALRACARGRRVTLTALSAQGRRALGWLSSKLEGSERQGDVLVVESPPPPHDADEETRLAAPSPIDALRLLATGWTLRGSPGPLSFLVAGSFAFDFIRCYEDLPEPGQDPLSWPDFEFWVPEELIVVDHRRRSARVTCYVFGGEGSEASYHDAARRCAELSELCAEVAARGLATPPPPPALGAAQASIDDTAFESAVRALKEHIYAGDVYQIVLSRSFTAPCADPLASYARLRALNPSPYMFYLRGGAGTLFGASPETAVKVSGAPLEVQIKPIAGTRKRGRDAEGGLDTELDSRLELELRLDEKELAEHVMLVDLARNDVARVSLPGSRSVDRLLTVERYSHVMHLVSSVRGELRPDLDALKAYVATMNMGTLTGAPKLRAAALLSRHENQRRGPYGGAVGYLSAEGELDTSIVIRSAVVRDGVAHVQAGAGIVHDSDPAAEADETRRKAAAVLQALGC
jgi:anthranilate synthase component I